MTEDEAKDMLIDVMTAVHRHKADVFEAYSWADLEQMVIAFDIANERLWRSVLGKES
jgi:hypothetical protein